ncbi:hypothetical protein PHYSODRAFT_303525 [Phytophthora sojae]|uniref:Uncharacterized protein n=1 Tax=Phytophthora sojae (strain P6497) TaxID=1094619 RepID=G4ZVF1_PHYSP|nr:hypothetical protein PHYSODRAFT_303525 [Phytophthora sojae]EGZ11469.1 hypothetical protein PHYSODRAFT_303525 [Phytophthora sojae]|eukprot:XP_009531802.1 hypothetical protein PHYSODRAFT_303525 [Phytophthora sojae]
MRRTLQWAATPFSWMTTEASYGGRKLTKPELVYLSGSLTSLRCSGQGTTQHEHRADAISKRTDWNNGTVWVTRLSTLINAMVMNEEFDADEVLLHQTEHPMDIERGCRQGYASDN